MKKIVLTFNLILFALFIISAQEQTPATEAGEDFDLNGVMAVLEESEDLADFEKKINDEKNQINNLDLNNDDEIDIIKVVEYDDGNTRLLVLQAVIGENDVQDIATIEIEKHGEEEISLQIIGDPDIYGPDYIVEPASAEGSQDGKSQDEPRYIIQPFTEEYSKVGNSWGNSFEDLSETSNTAAVVFVSVHRWRPIRPLFVVGRVVFVSAVGWKAVPIWFIVRRPIARSSWRGRSRGYKSSRYRSTKSRHSKKGKSMYSNKRKKSSKAKNNFGAKPAPSKKPSTSPNPSKSSNKKATPSNKSTSPNKSKSKNSSTSPKKKKN